MGFNEMTHAFLAARYYIRLTEQFGDRGREAFIHGIQYYGSQRGRRMAQRAIRDGKPLTYENYCRYGEWVNTEEIKAMGAANRVEIGGYDPDYIHVRGLPSSRKWEPVRREKPIAVSWTRPFPGALIRTSGMRCPRPSTPTTTASRSSGTPGSLRK
mgnify:CR=1 FL=1